MDDAKKHYDDSYASGQYAAKYNPDDRPFWAESVDDWTVAFTGAVLGLKPGSKVLDLGSGLGFIVEAWRRHGIKAEGVELSSVAIEASRCKEYLMQGDASTDLPNVIGEYDAVCSSALLEHLTDAQCERLLTDALKLAPVTAHMVAHDKGNDPGHINIHPPQAWLLRFRLWCPHAVMIHNPLFPEAPLFIGARENQIPPGLLWAMKLQYMRRQPEPPK